MISSVLDGQRLNPLKKEYKKSCFFRSFNAFLQPFSKDEMSKEGPGRLGDKNPSV
jgi:hypothetical protein